MVGDTCLGNDTLDDDIMYASAGGAYDTFAQSFEVVDAT